MESFAGATAERLDDTYHSLLEKLSALQGTVAALKELAEGSERLSSTFSNEADELVTDTSSQLDEFGQFEDQQKRIESLQGRIHAGRERIKALSGRVDAVSERIESWELADREWQERTRKRLRAVWVVTLVVVFLVLSLFFGAQYAQDGLEETTTRIAGDGLSTLKDVAGGKTEVLLSSRESEPQAVGKSTNGTETMEAPSPGVLRAFDEL